MRALRDKRELTERNQQMAALRRDGLTLREIASRFGVSEVRVLAICNREADRQLRESPHKYSAALT